MKSHRAVENSLKSMCVVKVLDLDFKAFKYQQQENKTIIKWVKDMNKEFTQEINGS